MPIDPPSPPRTKCPYTLTPLTSLVTASDEHIVPESLGGTLAFSFVADRDKNSWLGHEVDAPLINAPITKLLLVHNQVRYQGKDPKAVLPGVIDGTDVRVAATLNADGSVGTFVRDKIKYDTDPATGEEDRTKGTIYGLPAEAESIAVALKRNRRDGKDVLFEPERSITDATLRTNLVLNTAEIRRGLYKIAFGALYWFLGDEYLDDAMVPDWHKMLFAADLRAAGESAISEYLLRDETGYGLFLPPLKPHEHAVSVARVGQQQIAASVGLFGAPWPYRASVVGSVTSTYGLELLEGWIAIIDAPARRIRFESFMDNFSRQCELLELPPLDSSAPTPGSAPDC